MKIGLSSRLIPFLFCALSLPSRCRQVEDVKVIASDRALMYSLINR